MPKYQYLVENSNTSIAGSLIITLKPKNASDIFNFKPGQYAMLSFYDKAGRFFINHPFSIASAPNQNGILVFGIKILGRFTQNLQKLEIGSQVEILGPFGNFVFDPKKHQDVVSIAGGVGITPFISAAEYATANHLTNRITLLYSVRTIKDALFYDYIKKLASINSNFKPKLKVTQETITGDFDYCENGYITKESITENVGSVLGKDFFICGPGQFMKVMSDNLLALGVPSKKIHQEAFNVTPDLSFRKNFINIFLVYGLSLAVFLGFLILMVPKIKESKRTSIDLINAAVNSRRNDLINSKYLLLNTISSVTDKTTVTAPAVKNPVVVPITNHVITPVIKPTITPVINVPVSAPRTRVS